MWGLEFDADEWTTKLQPNVELLVELHKVVTESSTLYEIRTWLDSHGIKYRIKVSPEPVAAPFERWS